MSYNNPYATPSSVAQAPADARSEFYQKTYLHLAGAIGLLILLEAALIMTPAISSPLIGLMFSSPYSWLVVLGVFMGVSWIADKWAHSDTSRGMQYLGLGLFIVAEAIILLPMIYMAMVQMAMPDLIMQAGIITGALFAGLTFVAFTTKKDFSFMGGMLKIGGFVAIGLIVASILIGFNLGIWFSGAMILFVGGTILYQTSNIIHHYRTDQYVAASLGLFASIATLFWYVLRFLMAFASDD